MGVSTNEEELDALITKHLGDTYTKAEDDDDYWVKKGDTEASYWRNDVIFDATGLVVEGSDDEWETGTSIGLSINNMKDDETKAQFSERVSDLLNKIGIETKPDFIYDGGYFG
jgi:hypothetical protein